MLVPVKSSVDATEIQRGDSYKASMLQLVQYSWQLFSSCLF